MGTCETCGGYGFVVERRDDLLYPYPCLSECNGDRGATVLDAHRALREHGDDLRVILAR
jgi:hypothetical protein